MDNQHALYHYPPLRNPRSARLLYLEPSSHTEEDFQVQLAEFSLDAPRPYWALSYSWDAQEASVPIKCCSQSTPPLSATERAVISGTLKITANCAAALRHFRHASERRTLWIDSICINQSSVEDRNEQVAHMAEIYKLAEKVVVWLGERDIPTDTAIAKLHELTDRRDLEAEDDPMDALRRTQRLQRIHDRAKRLMEGIRSEADDPIGPFFARTWMWCVQELVLPSGDKVFFHCGDLEIPWITIFGGLESLEAIRYPWNRWKELVHLHHHFTILRLCHSNPLAREILDSLPGESEAMDNYPVLSRILTLARAKASTDPRDKIFSLHGILTELEVPIPRPDYNKSIAQVYTEAARSSIEYDRILSDTLLLVPSDKRRPGLPSWVPDYSDLTWGNFDARHAVLRSRFAAGGTQLPRWEFQLRHTNTLVVFGKIRDTIQHKAAPIDFENPYTMDISFDTTDAAGNLVVSDFASKVYAAIQVLKEWIDVSSWSDAPTYPFSDESLKTSFQRTVVADLPENNAVAERNGAFEAWYSILTSTELEIAAGVLRRWFPTPVLPGWSPAAVRQEAEILNQTIPKEVLMKWALMNGDGSPGWRFLSTVLPFMDGKCFIRTEEGRFGTVPVIGGRRGGQGEATEFTVRAGDRIAVVAGLEMPVVLRAVDDGWRLITHCYLHGAMYGEWWSDDIEDLGDRILLV